MSFNIRLIVFPCLFLTFGLGGCGAGIKESASYFDEYGNSVTFENGFATYSTCGVVIFPYSNKAGKTVVDWSGCKPGTQCAQMGCNAEDETFTGDADTLVNNQGRTYYRSGSPGYYKIRDKIKAYEAGREQMMQEARKRYHEQMKQSQPNN